MEKRWGDVTDDRGIGTTVWSDAMTRRWMWTVSVVFAVIGGCNVAPPKSPQVERQIDPELMNVTEASRITKGSLKSKFAPLLDDLSWGFSQKQVSAVYIGTAGLFDREYAKIVQKVEPGIRLKALEAERDNYKRTFGESESRFGDTPNGYDATPLKGEYSYRNGESLLHTFFGGGKRYFFFFGDKTNTRLWKVIVELPLTAGAPFGNSIEKVRLSIGKLVGEEPAEEEPAEGGMPDDAKAAKPKPGVKPAKPAEPAPPKNEWQDGDTHIRLREPEAGKLWLVLEDVVTLQNLATFRKNKDAAGGLDPEVALATKNGVSDPTAGGAKIIESDSNDPKGKKPKKPAPKKPATKTPK